jgi:hyperosmotically inducible protein
MRTKIHLLSITILAAGMSLAPAVFAQDNPNNPNNGDSSATAPADQGKSTTQSVKESVGNAASDVDNGAKSAYHKTSSAITSTKITAKAKTALLRDDETKHSTIHVKTKSGVVTLSGKVDSEAIAEHAQQVVAGIEGVKEVRNNLKY